MEFDGIIKIRSVNPYVLVSASRAKRIRPGWRRPLPVKLRINGGPADPWRVNLMPIGNGGFYLYLHGGVRKASGTGVGDRVHVSIEFDAAYRNGPQHPVPDWFRNGLEKEPRAIKNWSALPPSRKKELIRYFAGLKSESARARNLARALHVLSGRSGHFMGRDWTKGS
jgi:hypothetical protein